MEEERAAFAYEVLPIAFTRTEDRREDLLNAAEVIANHVVEASDGHFEAIPPLLVIEQAGELHSVHWRSLLAIEGDDFQEFVMPETVRALDPDGVVLLTLAVPGEDNLEAWIMMCAIDRMAEDQPGITLEAPVIEEDDRSFTLGEFELLGSGVPPAVARILRRPG